MLKLIEIRSKFRNLNPLINNLSQNLHGILEFSCAYGSGECDEATTVKRSDNVVNKAPNKTAHSEIFTKMMIFETLRPSVEYFFV